MKAWLIDSTIDFISTEIVKITPLVFAKNFSEESHKAAANFGQTVGAFFERQLKEHGKDFLCGDKLTIADFAVMANFHAFVYNEDSMAPADWRAKISAEVEKFELWTAYMKRFDAVFAEWIAQRPKTPW